jgi:hypothetical protein
MRAYLLVLLLMIGCPNHAAAGKKFRVLFIGNSYTYVNNMPQIVSDIATSMGDTLVWDIQAPGGAAFYDHCTDATTLSKIQAGNWNYVVLQEQSQTPALPDVLVQGMFPQPRKLDSLVNAYNSCAETIFYMTWGRKNGDASNCSFYTVQYNWPWYCTYLGMDSVIRLRYRMMADTNQSIISPAGAVWRYIRSLHPSIELYDADGSHPSPAGSYAVACAFYVTLFKKDPTAINYDYFLSGSVAADIRNAAKKVVYDSISYWHIGQYRTEAAFSYNQSGNKISVTNNSLNASGYRWFFGDGQTDTALNPTHTYAQNGTYTVMLIAKGTNGCSDTSFESVSIAVTSTGHLVGNNSPFTISPNPCYGTFTIELSKGTADVIVQNACGQIVFRQSMQQRLEVDLRSCPAGLYLVRVLNEHVEQHGRLMVY